MKRCALLPLRLFAVTLLTAAIAACGGGDPSDPAIVVSISPERVSLEAGASTRFAAAVAGTDNKSILWSVQEGDTGGRVNAEGEYTAPVTPGTYHVVATAEADPAKSATATVTVTAPRTVSVSVSPSAVTLTPGASQPFSATVSGADNTAVTWSVQEGSTGGSITSQGVYTAPGTPGTYHVVATSAADPTRSATATITVANNSNVLIAILPLEATLAPLGMLQFQAAVEGSSNTGVNWKVEEGAAGGSITAQGLYTAPDATGEFHVTAISQANNARTATATVRVVRGVSVAISPSPVTVSVGAQQSFQATVLGAINTSVTWSVQEGSAGGSITSQGVYTAPGAPGTYHVVATSVVDPTRSATATINVTTTPVVSVTVSPTTAAVRVGGSQTFTAAVFGTSNTAVTWSVIEPGGGSITAQGAYTAPTTAGTYHVVATSVADTSKRATATVTVLAPVSLVLVPPVQQMMVGAQQTFAALVRNALDARVTWSVMEGSAAGSIAPDGTYTAPGTPGVYHVVATSVEDPSKSSTALVSVGTTRALSVAIFPGTATVAPGEFLSFTATVSGASYTSSVVWRVEEPEGGRISPQGVYVAPRVPGTYHVVATNYDDTSWDAVATVTVAPPGEVRVRIVPEAVNMRVGQPQTFSASVSGTANTAVTWSVVGGSASGSISPDGTYTAPATPGIYRVVATSMADPSKSYSTEVVVESSGSNSAVISPAAVTLAPGAYQSFTFFSGSGSVTPTAVYWRVLEAGAGGGVSPSGLYKAPETEGTYHLMASSYSDRPYAVATIRVARQQTPTVSVLPGNVRLRPGQKQAFAAHVTEVNDPAVTWSTNGGVINSEGIFTASTVPGTYSVRATSVVIPQASQTVQVVVVDDFRESGAIINPTSVTVATGSYFAFTGMNTGASNNAVYWSVLEGPAGGSITGRGEYIAPLTPGTYTVVMDGGGYYAPAFAYAVVRVVKPTLTFVSVLPIQAQVPPGGRLSVIANVSGNTDTRVQWSTSGGTLQDGLYTAPTTPGSYLVTATSVADPTRNASALITVPSQPGAISVGLSPAERVVAPGAFASFQLHLSGISPTSATALSLRVLEAPEGGTLLGLGSGAVEYFAPSVPGRYHLSTSFYSYTSTSPEPVETVARVSVAARPGVSVSLRPNPATLPTTAQQTFTAHVAGASNTQVTWSATGGSIAQDGTYTTPSQPGVYSVTATSVADPSKSATSLVQVVSDTSAAAVKVTPSVVRLPPGGTMMFSAEAWSPFFPYVYWNVVGDQQSGSIDYLGNYKAPITPGVYYVMATAVDGEWYARGVATVIVE